ncbi:hypothetical protein G7054_g1023 [Neopestalotiopsis clavispora]|nr:hypothetical protein G7054_g1023 [Neopestalotiopsis clavispora]
MSGQNHQSILLLMLAAANRVVIADTYQYYTSTGTTIPDVNEADNYTVSLFENGLANPNATRSVEFNPFASISGLINTSSPLYQNWNLHFSVPNAASIAENETDFKWYETTFVDPHITDYSYGLSWPSGGLLESALPDNVTDLCFTTISFWGTPANVSNLLSQQDADDSTDCSFVLGTECVDAIERTIRTDGSCQGVSTSWYSLDACADTLGYAAVQDYNSKSRAVFTQGFNKTVMDSGDTFWGGWTSAHNGSDTSQYDRLSTGLQVMAFSPTVTSGETNVSRTQVICTRINAAQVDEEEYGDDDDTSAGWSTQASSGVATMVTLGWVLAAAHVAW